MTHYSSSSTLPFLVSPAAVVTVPRQRSVSLSGAPCVQGGPPFDLPTPSQLAAQTSSWTDGVSSQSAATKTIETNPICSTHRRKRCQNQECMKDRPDWCDKAKLFGIKSFNARVVISHHAHCSTLVFASRPWRTGCVSKKIVILYTWRVLQGKWIHSSNHWAHTHTTEDKHQSNLVKFLVQGNLVEKMRNFWFPIKTEKLLTNLRFSEDIGVRPAFKSHEGITDPPKWHNEAPAGCAKEWSSQDWRLDEYDKNSLSK